MDLDVCMFLIYATCDCTAVFLDKGTQIIFFPG